MPRPDLKKTPPFFHNYVNQAPGNDVNKVIGEQSASLFRFLSRIPAVKRNYRYARGKWTIQEMLQHLVDTERVFAYRALCFARQDKTSLPSFDENSYALHSGAGRRDWNDLIDEFKALRRSTEIMFRSFNKKQLQTEGIANQHSVSVLAMGFIIAGHVNHHLRILKERYL